MCVVCLSCEFLLTDVVVVFGGVKGTMRYFFLFTNRTINATESPVFFLSKLPNLGYRTHSRSTNKHGEVRKVERSRKSCQSICTYYHLSYMQSLSHWLYSSYHSSSSPSHHIYSPVHCLLSQHFAFGSCDKTSEIYAGGTLGTPCSSFSWVLVREHQLRCVQQAARAQVQRS